MSKHEIGRQHLYRMFDSADRLVYVGISTFAIRRMCEHRDDKPWFDDVVRIEVEHHDCTRAWIEAYEKQIVDAERPLVNKVHNKASRRDGLGGRPRRSLFTKGDVYGFGLRGGECPVGIVIATSADDDLLPPGTVALSLFDWVYGTFGPQRELVHISDVERFIQGYDMDPQKAEREGYVINDGERFYDMDPLGAFQTRWDNKHKELLG